MGNCVDLSTHACEAEQLEVLKWLKQDLFIRCRAAKSKVGLRRLEVAWELVGKLLRTEEQKWGGS